MCPNVRSSPAGRPMNSRGRGEVRQRADEQAPGIRSPSPFFCLPARQGGRGSFEHFFRIELDAFPAEQFQELGLEVLLLVKFLLPLDVAPNARDDGRADGEAAV